MIASRSLLVAVISVTSWNACVTEVHEERFDSGEPPESLYVDVASGDVRIVGSDVQTVTIIAKIEGRSNHLGHDLSEGALSVFDECNDSPCGVDIEALVPKDLPLEIHTGSGDIRLDATHAPLVIETGSGDIAGADLGGLDLAAETGSGDIELRVLSPLERVDVHTGSGDVQLAVPAGSYRLDVTTGSGDESVSGVSHDASSTSSIDVDTGSGDVRIRGR